MMGSVLAPAGQARGRQFADRLERLLRRRDLQRDAFVERAKMWESGRPEVAGPVEFPRDEALVIRLGVPCVDCLVLVFERGQVGGNVVAEVEAELEAVAVMRGDTAPAVPRGHVVTFGMVPGRHWAQFVAARCPR